MPWHVYADLSRELTSLERSAVADALDRFVPRGGCVGRQKGPADEVYFSVEAPNAEEAQATAARYMSAVLREAGLNVAHTIQLKPDRTP